MALSAFLCTVRSVKPMQEIRTVYVPGAGDFNDTARTTLHRGVCDLIESYNGQSFSEQTFGR